MSDLLRCPFCGGSASLGYERRIVQHTVSLFYFVACDLCGASTRSEGVRRGSLFDDEEWDNPVSSSVEQLWNTRNGDS